LSQPLMFWMGGWIYFGPLRLRVDESLLVSVRVHASLEV